jgi:hypothetical protein
MHSPNSLSRPARSSLLAGFGKLQFIAAAAAWAAVHYLFFNDYLGDSLHLLAHFPIWCISFLLALW